MNNTGNSVTTNTTLIESPIEPMGPLRWSPSRPTMRGPSIPPGISKAFRAHAAARLRTYVGKNSVAKALVMHPDPSPKKIARHRKGSITTAEWIWNRATPNKAEHDV